MSGLAVVVAVVVVGGIAALLAGRGVRVRGHDSGMVQIVVLFRELDGQFQLAACRRRGRQTDRQAGSEGRWM